MVVKGYPLAALYPSFFVFELLNSEIFMLRKMYFQNQKCLNDQLQHVLTLRDIH